MTDGRKMIKIGSETDANLRGGGGYILPAEEKKEKRKKKRLREEKGEFLSVKGSLWRRGG